MPDLPMLGRTIADRRKQRRLSRMALARQAQVSPATLNALENGRLRELGFNKLTRILAALGMELVLQNASDRWPTLDELRDEEQRDQDLDRRG
ncbi:MAG TPA: helix-turn-helix transcriptional regulator [Terriglobales bacterium]|nr:helix-turn-helix transcriptional regulator [Terriglobales bacterium]